jgi:hypothetical protein
LLTTWTSLKIPFALPLISTPPFDLLRHAAPSMVQKQPGEGLWERYPNEDFYGVPLSSLFNSESQGWIVENQGCFLWHLSVRDPFTLVARDAVHGLMQSLYVVVLV